MKETKAQFILNLLKDIPEKNWTTRTYTDEKSKCCALGHIIRLTSKNPKDYNFFNCNLSSSSVTNKEFSSHFKTSQETNTYLSSFIKEKRGFHGSFANINDGTDLWLLGKKTNETYRQSSPKQRVILFLEWMVKEGW